MSTIDPRWPLLGEGATNSRMSSTLLEATALARGLDTVRLNGDSFVAGRDPFFSDFGFWGALSSETSRAAVRVTRDRVKRKTALSKAGIRVPQSRRFGYRHVDQAIDYALRFSRGVIVKPRALSAGAVSRKALTEPDQVRQTISSWKESPGSGVDYLVEARILGPEYVFYIVAGQVESVVLRRNRAWFQEIYRRDSFGASEVSPKVLDLAVSALRAVPKTPYGEVRIVGRDALSDPERGRVVSLRPTIELINGNSTQDWSLHMADRLVAHGMIGSASTPTGSAGQRVTAQLIAAEIPDASSVAAAVTNWLSSTGTAGDVRAIDRELTGTLTGTPGELSSLASLMRTGKLVRVVPQTVKLRKAPS